MSDPVDPPPIAPEKPLPADCCDGGCTVCVWEAYDDALRHYEAQLSAWRERQEPAPGPG